MPHAYLPYILAAAALVALAGGAIIFTDFASPYPPKGWVEYRNDSYRFSLFHPNALSVDEFPGPDDTMTVVFQNADEGMGFQLFMLPYRNSQISEERFKKDVPSGVRTDVTDMMIDGVPATAFYSSDLSLGETYEVWVIQDGYLYEITTLKPLDRWLDSILQSWKFI